MGRTVIARRPDDATHSNAGFGCPFLPLPTLFRFRTQDQAAKIIFEIGVREMLARPGGFSASRPPNTTTPVRASAMRNEEPGAESPPVAQDSHRMEIWQVIRHANFG